MNTTTHLSSQACGTVKAEVNVCLLGFSMGADPAKYFEATFSSAVIAPVTSHFSQFDDPTVGTLLAAGGVLADPDVVSAEAWCEQGRRRP